MRKLFFYLTSIALLLSACKGTRTVTMNSMRPAEITFPSHVNTLLIVDRSKFNKDGVNILEGVLTSELPGEDKAGIQALINAFQQQLTYSPRFSTKIATERLDGNSLTSAFPDQLSWNQVSSLCRKYNADAVVAIEIFDTDFVVTDGQRTVERQVETRGEKRTVKVNEYFAEGIGNIVIGIRLYDPKEQYIVDQQLLKDTHSWEAAASTLKEALLQLTSKSDATRYLSKEVGANYAYKIAPMPVRITRTFYGKSKKAPALEQGSRFADVGKWEEAADVWKNGINGAPTKESGYLAYNVAIAYEVLGDIDRAKHWAQLAYTQYGNKDARSYVNLLNRRVEQERLANDQLN